MVFLFEPYHLQARSTTLATYALCGFSSISTLAIAVGVWNSLCPQRTKEMASNMFRSLTNANISCFMTACIAGMYRIACVLPCCYCRYSSDIMFVQTIYKKISKAAKKFFPYEIGRAADIFQG